MKKFNLKTAIQCIVFVCVLIILSQVSMAGNLEPNAPPASTMKPLDQVEPRIAITTLPFTILASGSYYLVSDLTASSGITVDANNVTIDLCGFSLIGTNGNGYGIYMVGRSNVEIRNGTIRNFSIGILETSTSGTDHRVICVRTVSNSRVGIDLLGSGHEVRGCTSSNNGTSASSGSSVYGIFAGNSSTVTGNTVRNNGNSASAAVYALFVGNDCTVTGNTVCDNANSATSYAYGLSTSNGCTVTNNTVCNNGTSDAYITVYGLYLAGNSLVCDNTAYNNNGTNVFKPSDCNYGYNYFYP